MILGYAKTAGGITFIMRRRSWTALAAIIIISSAAHAGVSEDLIAAINKCATMTDATARHACYDQLPNVVKALVPAGQATTAQASPAPAPAALTPPPATLPAAPAVASATPQQPRNDIPEERSLFESEPVAASHIDAAIESYTYDFGLFVVTLDNGQVWRQVASVGDIVHLHQHQKDHVKIWRNAFGVYVMKIDGYLTHYRVRRVQ